MKPHPMQHVLKYTYAKKGVNGIWTQFTGVQYRERSRQQRPSGLVSMWVRNEAVLDSQGQKMEVGKISGRGEL
jgi:hypothetical protein